METIKKYWKAILAAVVAVLGILVFQRKRISTLILELLSVKNRVEDARLDEKNNALEKEKQTLLKEQQKIQDEIKDLSPKSLSPDEVKEYWKNK